MARHAWSPPKQKQSMKDILLFVVIVAWIILCSWAVEKLGNLIPDRAMRLLTKFLLFVLFFTLPVLHLAGRTTEPGASGKRSEDKAQRSGIPMNGYTTDRKGLQ
jgi:hypothetical protein